VATDARPAAGARKAFNQPAQSIEKWFFSLSIQCRVISSDKKSPHFFALGLAGGVVPHDIGLGAR
jgi:hypothetical protein